MFYRIKSLTEVHRIESNGCTLWIVKVLIYRMLYGDERIRTAAALPVRKLRGSQVLLYYVTRMRIEDDFLKSPSYNWCNIYMLSIITRA